MTWLEFIILGIVSGLGEFLPISSSGHQMLFLHLLGIKRIDPLFELFILIGLTAAVITACGSALRRVLAERAIELRGSRFQTYGGRRYEYRLVRTASIPMIFGFLFFSLLPAFSGLPVLVFAFLINGIVLFVSGNMRQGNKDSRNMTKLDSMLIGFSGIFSAIPGISPIATTASCAVGLGALPQHALNWSLLISVPLLLARTVLSLFSLFVSGTSLGFVGILFALIGAVAAFGGARASIRFVRFAASHIGLSGFAYYCWGASLLSFILYLIT